MFWKKKKPKKRSREDIIAEAKANAAKARHEIGDETLDKIKMALEKKQNSELEKAKAKAKVKAMDEDKVRDNLSLWLKEND
ncbi:MAG: hypothetical protein AAF988_03060 [Pseudomonadota bacterium]